MLDKLAFTLYELFGYLVPGGVVLLGMLLLFWAFIAPVTPLNATLFQANSLTSLVAVVGSYLLGHGAQAIGNLFFKSPEEAALGTKGSVPEDIRRHAQELSAKLLDVPSQKLNPGWICKTLDEYCVQAGKLGDREIFVYREGFYRGTIVALFFLTAALVVRTFFSGASIQVAGGLFYVSNVQLLAVALTTVALGRLFISRYRRFGDYRVSRTVIAALVLQKIAAESEPRKAKVASTSE